MDCKFSYIPYKETGFFSKLVTDYIDDSETIRPFFRFGFDKAGLDEATAERAKYKVDREVLSTTLGKQYASLNKHPRTEENLLKLADENTYTVCTAHQPNLLTGYLYFVYKILHAIKLADQLNSDHPGKHFVPVYYMGSEDNDIEELGVFKFRGEKFVWVGDGQQGAVGRMLTSGPELKDILTRLLKLLGPPGANCDKLAEIFTQAYFKHNTIAAATQYLVNELFGQYGLIVLNPDDAAFKTLFIPVMEDELLAQHSGPVIAGQIEQLGAHYKIQAHPREINLFYLTDQLRARIEKKENKWVVVNTAIEWNKTQLLEELYAHPERFSPNVMLRGLYQETILPDVAFIGGGAEVAYWMQLSNLFSHYKVFLPAIILRQSVMYINTEAKRLQGLLHFSLQDIFADEIDLERAFIERQGNNWKTTGETADIEGIFAALKEKATGVDATLAGAAEAALTKMKYQLAVLEKKMLRAEKKKQLVMMDRISRLKAIFFPGGNLQERVENFTENYLYNGQAFFEAVLQGIIPYEPQFLVISEML